MKQHQAYFKLSSSISDETRWFKSQLSPQLILCLWL